MKNILLIITIFMLFACKSAPEPEPVKSDVVEYDHSYRVKAYNSLSADKRYIRSNNDVEIILNAYSWAFRGSDCVNPLVETVEDLYFQDSFNISDPGMGDLIFFIDSDGNPYRVGMLEGIEGGIYSFIMLSNKNKPIYISEELDQASIKVKRLRPIKKAPM